MEIRGRREDGRKRKGQRGKGDKETVTRVFIYKSGSKNFYDKSDGLGESIEIKT